MIWSQQHSSLRQFEAKGLVAYYYSGYAPKDPS